MLFYQIIFYISYFAFPALAIFIYFCWKNKNRALNIFLAAACALFIYARFIEPNIITEKDYNIQISQHATSRIKIAVISDLHIGVFKNQKFLQRIVLKTNKMKPDIILIPGDFAYKTSPEKIIEDLKPLKDLESPSYAVIGNHDDGSTGTDVSDSIIKALNLYGVAYIEDKAVSLEYQDKTIQIIGVKDYFSPEKDYSIIKKNYKKDLLLVLTHNPDAVYDFPSKNIDLVVTGHTHGGQIRIPFLYKRAIPCNYPFDEGMYQAGDTKIFVSPGLGMVGLPLRFLKPPEIDLLTVNY